MRKLFLLLVLILLLPACRMQFLQYPEGQSPPDAGLSWTTFENDYFSISYPMDWRVRASGDKVIFRAVTGEEVLAIVQEDIPRAPLLEEKIEDTFWGKLYHDMDAKTGTRNVDKLITDVPGSTKDFYLAGYGEIFERMLKSLKLKEQEELKEEENTKELVMLSVYFAGPNADFFETAFDREVLLSKKYEASVEALLAGPSEEEKALGALNIVDESLKLEEFKFENGVARIYLTGNLCNIPGAAFNVKNLIFKTFEQFEEVTAVKIYLDGETEQADEPVDSFPPCLEP